MAQKSVQNLMRRMARTSRESWRLLQGALPGRRSDTFRHLLLMEAQQGNNQVAARLLQWHQQFNLVQYYGILGYARQRQGRMSVMTPGLMTGPRYASSDSNSHLEQRNDSPPAKLPAPTTTTSTPISFMITTQMKQQLDELGYSEAAVKRMTPLEASLILQHKLSPHRAESELPALVQQYQHEQEAQAQQVRQQAAAAAAQQQQQNILQTDQQQEVGVVSSSPAPAWSIFSKNLLRHTANGPGDVGKAAAKVWYEVLEHGDDDRTSIVALYQNEHEAELGKQTQELFAARRAHDHQRENRSTFTVRAAVRK